VDDLLNSGSYARRVRLSVTIGGRDVTDAVSPDLLSFEVTDHAHGKADDLRLSLRDTNGRWSGAWLPAKGTPVSASILCLDWTGPGKRLGLNFGRFAVDEAEFGGPPDQLQIKAVSASTATAIRQEARTRAWESASLRVVAGDIASRHKLKLYYDGEDYPFSRQDQREESDLAFLKRLCEERGVNLKVHDGRLVLFGAQAYDAKSAVLTVTKHGGNLPALKWGFKSVSGKTFKACEVAWLDPETRDLRTYTFAPHGQPPSEQLLRINRRVESQAEAMQLAQAELRKHNKGEFEGTLDTMGHPGLVAGIVIAASGFGKFDGRYFVEEAGHSIDGKSAYTSRVKIRSALSY
jgi:phage protein D